MRKKTILGNFIKNTDVRYDYSIRTVSDSPEHYSAVIHFLPGSRTLAVDNNGRQAILSGEGYTWLMYLPLHEKWCLNAFYNPKNDLIQFYFDISKVNFVDEQGMPCLDDIFLDLVILPDGQALTIDADELQEALSSQEITPEDYHHAYAVHDQILASPWNNVGMLAAFCKRLLQEHDGGFDC